MEREEARLMVETAELRIETVLARMESRMEAFQMLMEERDRRHREEMSRFSADMTEFRTEIRSDIKGLRRTVIVTGISAVLAILFGVSAVNASLLSQFHSGVEVGTRSAAEHEAMRRDIRALAAALPRQAAPPQAMPKK